VFFRQIMLFSCSVALVSGIALAQSQAALPRANFLSAIDGEFRKMDADKNGIVTRSEVVSFQRLVAVAESGARNRALFAQLDADRNGQISPAEFRALAPATTIDPQPLMTRYDTNRDGSVSQVEYRTVKLNRFDRIDGNQDGVVTAAEQRASGLEN